MGVKRKNYLLLFIAKYATETRKITKYEDALGLRHGFFNRALSEI